MSTPGPLYTAEGWFQALRCPEFVAYLAAGCPTLSAGRSELLAARQTLRSTPLIADILASQDARGDWPAYADGGSERLWFRQFPVPLSVLCEAGFTLDDEPVRRASARLLSTLDDGVFRNPWREVDEPLEYYEAHNGNCLEAAGRCGLGGHPRVQRAVEVALAHQRWDGGWSTMPARRGQAPAESKSVPSCPICTALMVRGLSHTARLSEAAIERILAYRLDERWGRRPENAIPELLLLLEFLARQGRRRSDPHVQRLFARLESARSPDGAFPPHLSARGWYPPEYTQVMVEYLRWWLGD